jgi:hypothetical protein
VSFLGMEFLLITLSSSAESCLEENEGGWGWRVKNGITLELIPVKSQAFFPFYHASIINLP